MNNELDKMEKYYRIASQYGDKACTEYLVEYYMSIKKYDEMKKYMFMCIDHDKFDSIEDNFYEYYNNFNDFSFLSIDINKISENNRSRFFDLMEDKLYNETLPKEYHERFCAIDFPGNYQ